MSDKDHGTAKREAAETAVFADPSDADTAVEYVRKAQVKGARAMLVVLAREYTQFWLYWAVTASPPQLFRLVRDDSNQTRREGKRTGVLERPFLYTDR